MTAILSSGRSSRFYESLVRQKQLSQGVNAFAEDARGPGLLRVIGSVLPGKTAADLEAGIDAEIERLKTDPIADWEIAKARTSARRSFINTVGSSMSKAVTMSQDALFFNDPGRINTREERIAKVTAADVQRVARQYLVKTSRTVVHTVPKAAAPKGGL